MPAPQIAEGVSGSVTCVRSSSVLELHREGDGYVIREVDLCTGDHILYLSTEEPEWAAWIWERKTHG